MVITITSGEFMLKKISEIVGTAKVPSDKNLYKITIKDLKEAMKRVASEEVIKNRIMGIFSEACKTVEINGEDTRVSDAVMDARIFSVFRRYQRDILDVSCLAKELKRGLMATIFGIRIWVQRGVLEIRCYGENSTVFKKDFPFLAESKKILKIKD